jgi:hypothetical protein
MGITRFETRKRRRAHNGRRLTKVQPALVVAIDVQSA